MREHWEAVEADFQAVYGIDLRIACYGRSDSEKDQGLPGPVMRGSLREGQIGVRRLFALLQGLPPKGAVHRELDPKGWDWSYTDELLMIVAQLLDYGNRLFIQINTKKGARKPKPLELRRPWDADKPDSKKEEQAKPSHDRIVQFFGGAKT